MQGYGDLRVYDTIPHFHFFSLLAFGRAGALFLWSHGLRGFWGGGAIGCIVLQSKREGEERAISLFLPISELAGEATSDPGVSRMHSSARLKISTLLESYHSWCFFTRRASRRPPKLDLDFLALIAIANPSANVVFEQRGPPPFSPPPLPPSFWRLAVALPLFLFLRNHPPPFFPFSVPPRGPRFNFSREEEEGEEEVERESLKVVDGGIAAAREREERGG